MKETTPDLVHELTGFVQQVANHFEPIAIDTDLLDEGLLDSMMLMDLVLSIEQRWNLKLSPYDISKQNFSTLARLEELVESRLTTPTPSS